MQNQESSLVKKLLKEIKLLEGDVETQAYISGLWIRFFTALKALVQKEYGGTALADIVDSAIRESESWEDIEECIEEARHAERQFFERVETDDLEPSDLKKLKTEVDFLRGVVRALLSTRKSRLESLMEGYQEWDGKMKREIENLLEQNGLVCEESWKEPEERG